MSQNAFAGGAGPQGDAWCVFDYEVNMWREMLALLTDENPRYATFDQWLKNAVVESAVLHTRILVDILLSRGEKKDDIKLSDMVPSFSSQVVNQLKAAYGNGRTIGNPCWVFNKMLAHPTRQRSDSYDYSGALNSLCPFIEALLDEINRQRP